MKRHYQVIFEAILSVLIIIDILVMGLMIAGLTEGIMLGTVYSIGTYDLIIALLILIDFIFYRIRKDKLNKNNWEFIRENWAYIVSIIPIIFICFNFFHLFGYIYIIGLIVILRFYALYKVLRITGKEVKKYPSKTKLDYATVVLLLVLVIGSYLLFFIEHGVNPGFSSFESAMWFALVSMTTTGYGDITPVTATGRIIAIILIFTGMGYLSLVTATLAYSFIDIFRKESRKAGERLEERALSYEKKVDEVKAKLDEIGEKME
ncbi:MAG: potassium channel family protein [Methanobacterium sp.]